MFYQIETKDNNLVVKMSNNFESNKNRTNLRLKKKTTNMMRVTVAVWLILSAGMRYDLIVFNILKRCFFFKRNKYLLTIIQLYCFLVGPIP